MRHVLSLLDLTRDEVLALLARAARLKSRRSHGKRTLPMVGKVLGLVFEKPSLRTRVSFEAAMAQLGGSTVFLSSSEAGLGTRETIPDFARTLSQYVDVVVLRTFAHGTVENFATHATVPVVNGLSDYLHPCQALADLLTVKEVFGDLQGRTLAFIGDGNNVARSLALGCGLVGMKFVLAAPKGYGFDNDFRGLLKDQLPRAQVSEVTSPEDAAADADVLYTDVWTSMGQENEREARRRAFARYHVSQRLLELAAPEAVVMHCLPAHRGEEITNDVLDGPRSVVFQQAGNRLHAQKALLEWLLAPDRLAPSRTRPRKATR